MEDPDSKAGVRSLPDLPFQLSPTLDKVVEILEDQGDVSAVRVAEEVIKLHPEYGDRQASTIQLKDDPKVGDRRGVIEWMAAVGRQFDLGQAGQLFGRLALLGLSRLDSPLEKQLQRLGFLDKLQKELTPNLETYLSEEGKRLWGLLPPDPDHPRLSDKTYLQLDNPAEQDELGRKPLAAALAVLLRYIRSQYDVLRKRSRFDQLPNQGFMVNLYGPWGSGKSSMIKFMAESLATPPEDPEEGINNQKWVVVNFNAWQQQRIDPPWWSILNSVYVQSRTQLAPIEAFELWLGETWRRIRIAFSIRLLAILILALLGAAALLITGSAEASGEPSSLLESIEDLFGSLEAIMGALLAVAGFGYAFSKTLLPGTASAAQSFMDYHQDPQQRIARHFNQLVRQIWWPVIIFIDDLDRCEASYVVRLLEGIQTLFREVSVFYCVAADLNWLRTSFGKEYQDFSDSVGEEGHPMDHLFMEKIFQLSIPVPQVTGDYKGQYWQRLVQKPGIPRTEADLSAETRAQAKAQLRAGRSETEILGLIEQVKGTEAEPVFRAEAVKRIVSPEIQISIEHRLMDYQHLVGSNPRTMKRLVNSYTVYQLMALLSGIDIPPDVLPLWAILTIQWPTLAEYLCEHPETVEYFSNPKSAASRELLERIPEEMRDLFQSDPVRQVVTGENVALSLNRDWLEKCAYLSS